MANGHNGILPIPGFHADYEAFYRLEHVHLVGFLRRRLPSYEDAEDAAQESLARFLRCADAEPAAAWRPLLYRIAINLTHDRLRSARIRHTGQHVPIDDMEIDADQPNPEEAAAQQQGLALLREAVMALPRRCREAYLLKYVAGFSTAEVARQRGVSVKTVEKHLAKALTRVSRQVEAAMAEGVDRA